MTQGRRGATPAVVRAMEGIATDRATVSETATCPECGGVLRFSTGEYGQTLERCETLRCVNAVPHHPKPDPAKQRQGSARGPSPFNRPREKKA